MRRVIRLLEVANAERVETTHVQVELYYSKGGMNYFTGKAERRGFYLQVTPVSISTSGTGLITRSYTAFTGIKKMVLECARFNQKKFDEFAPSEDEVNELLDYVKAKNGITTKEVDHGTEH